jgi:chlorite dismutase
MMNSRFVHALALGLDPAWRALTHEQRCRSARVFAGACEAGTAVTTLSYSMIGLQAGTDLLLWSLGPSLEALEERAAAALRTGLGAWTVVRESLLGVIAPSPYVRARRPAEPRLFSGCRARYLVVYPFAKDAGWYLLGQETRQSIMNEHMRVGHGYPQVRQLLANSFGLDDQDYLVAYETDEVTVFSQLVRELRATQARRSTLRDTPVLAAVHRPLPEIMRMLGA